VAKLFEDPTSVSDEGISAINNHQGNFTADIKATSLQMGLMVNASSCFGGSFLRYIGVPCKKAAR
jgi:hypothetical protein